MSVTFLGDTLKTSSHLWTVPTHNYTDTTLDLFRLPVVSQETISVHLQWETLGLIGHISSFFLLVQWTWLQRSAVRKPLSSRTNQWLLWPWLTAVCSSNRAFKRWPLEQTYLFFHFVAHPHSYNTEHFSATSNYNLFMEACYWLLNPNIDLR